MARGLTILPSFCTSVHRTVVLTAFAVGGHVAYDAIHFVPYLLPLPGCG